MIKYKLRGKVVLWPGAQSVRHAQDKGAWHFVYVDKKKSEIIKKKFGGLHRGFNSIPIEAKIGKTSWKTSIFYDTRSKAYLLPLKASVRKKENIFNGDTILFSLTLIV